jgi:hypothetical protein
MSDDSGEKGEDDYCNPIERSLSLDAVLSLLADERRRDLVRFLVEEVDETASIRECTDHVVECEQARTGDRPAYDQVEMKLHHVHVPKLASSGIIEYDPRNREFRYHGHEAVESWLDRIQAHEDTG